METFSSAIAFNSIFPMTILFSIVFLGCVIYNGKSKKADSEADAKIFGQIYYQSFLAITFLVPFTIFLYYKNIHMGGMFMAFEKLIIFAYYFIAIMIVCFEIGLAVSGKQQIKKSLRMVCIGVIMALVPYYIMPTFLGSIGNGLDAKYAAESKPVLIFFFSYCILFALLNAFGRYLMEKQKAKNELSETDPEDEDRVVKHF